MTSYLPARFLTILGCTALFSCGNSEKEEELVLTGDYQTQTSAQVSGLQMYSSAGQITNPAVISKFLNKDTGFGAYKYGNGFVQNGTTQSLPGTYLISFKDGQKATITLPSSSSVPRAPVETRITEKTNQQVVLTSLDSMQQTSGGLGSYIENINAYKAPGKCYPVTTASGFFTRCMVAPVFPIHHNKGELSLPLFSFFLQATSPTSSSLSWGNNMFGSIDRSVLSKMGPGDTLVIQSKKVLLEKR